MDIALQPVINFGKMPIANAFLTPEEFGREYFYEMVLGYDPRTKAVGLMNIVPREMMFHDHYAYYSSTSRAMKEHFRRAAETLLPYAEKGIVVEVGSNDGIMLDAWRDLGVRAMGVEPSANVARVAQEKGHEVTVKFMDDGVIDEILARGPVSVIYEANSLISIDDIAGYFRMAVRLIGGRGICVIEDPYFLDVMEKNAYDQIYDEHIWYFTIGFINALAAPFGLHVFDIEHLETHGGSMRMYIGRQDAYPVKNKVLDWVGRERELPRLIENFSANIERSKRELVELLSRCKKEGARLCGFGATSKGVIVCNYCGIGPDLIPFITDNTPAKQGKYYPGVHIPVVGQEEFKNVDHAMLFAWNHFKEIDANQAWFRQSGGKWITHVPAPMIIERGDV